MRFVVLRTLGRGGTGHVELVRDLASGEELARKRLRRVDSARIQALKRELRLVGSLVHPNLVRIYELGEERGELYLIMEAVHGDDVVASCRRDGRISPALASVLPQLLRVLRFLHGRGLAHGDLSPGNVLVRRDGRVKVLDFGMSAARDTPRRDGGGTPGYMPPEQAAGGAPTGEGDLYSLGAILRDIAFGAQGAVPARGTVPEPLASAIQRLLSEDARDRPSIDELEGELLPALSAPRARVDASASKVVPLTDGTPRLRREWLEARIFGTVVSAARQLVVLRGRSGVGKTSLARVVAGRAREAGLSVSWARARPESSIAFNLIDELIDDACERLHAVSVDVRGAALRTSRVFPALARLAGAEPHADLVRRAVRAQLFGHGCSERAPVELLLSRGALFGDLRVLIEAVDPSAEGRLLILDDLQWADGDSLAFVASLLDFSDARCTVLATTRAPTTSLDAWLKARPNVSFVDVAPFAVDDVTAFLEQHGGFDPPVARRVAAACEGLPAMFELALRSPGSVDPLRDAIAAVVRDGERDEKRALAALLVASAPLTVGERDLSRRAIDVLVRQGLVVRSESVVDLLHDSLRDPLRDALGPDWLRAAHDSRARSPTLPDEQVVRHLLGAGRLNEAFALARGAAEHATSVLAYGLSADLYAVALRGEDTPELRRRRAEALMLACRFDEAADAWAELRREADHDNDRAELFLAEAQAHLAGRRIANGRRCLDAALRASGERGLSQSTRGRVVTIARFLAGPMGSTRRAPVSLATAERFLRSAALVGYFDTPHGLELLLRAREAFGRLDGSESAAWCDFLLAFFARSAHAGGRGLALRYRRAAERRLGGRAASNPLVRSFPGFLDAYDALRDADFRVAIDRFDAALDGVVGTPYARSFEVELTTSLRTSAVLATQGVDAAEAAVARFAAFARDGVNVAVQCHVENARALVSTWRGRFEEGADTMARLRADWPEDPVTIQLVLIETYSALPEVLLGRAVAARERLRLALRRARHLAIFRGAYGPIVAAIAAMTELVAHHAALDGDLGAARRWARLAASRPSIITGLGHRVLAALDDLDGRPTRATEGLMRAEQQALRRGQVIDVALAQFALSRRLARPSLEVAARANLTAAGASFRLLLEYDLLRAR